MRSGDRAGRSFDPSALRELLRSGATVTDIGVVTSDPEADAHYEIVDDEEHGKGILVCVRLGHGGQLVWARLGATAGGAGSGVWSIPREGTEVAVLLPMADEACPFYGADPLVVAVFSSGAAPPDGLDDGGTIVICPPSGKTVLVHDGTASDAKPLVNVQPFNDHKHKNVKLKCSIPAGEVIIAVVDGVGEPNMDPIDLDVETGGGGEEIETKVPTDQIAGTSVLMAK